MGRTFGLLFALFCVGAVLGQGAILLYWSSTGTLSQDRLGKIFSLLRGEEIAPAAVPVTGNSDKERSEPASLDEIEQMRSLRNRGVELRELSVASNMDLLKSIRREIDGKIDAHREAHTVFAGHLRNLREGAITEGREKIRALWENIKSKQAKEQITEMIEADEREDVVAIFNMMSVAKQAKIIAEFKTDKEVKQLAEVLRDIRKGNPATPFLNKTIDDLDKTRGN